MPDPNHIPGYDAWKTSGPDEDDNSIVNTYIELGIRIDFNSFAPDDAESLALDARAAVVDALRAKLGLQLSDIEVDIDTANQEWVDL